MPTNFLWFNGTTSNSGLLVSAFTAISTEMVSLANGSTCLSTVAGATGVLNNSEFGQGIWADVFFQLGNPVPATALTAGANIAVWWLTSLDGGTTFETTNTTSSPPRAADCVIPLPAATAIATSIYKSQGLVRIPALEFKVLVQNNTGQGLNGTTTSPNLKIAPFAVQY